MTHPHPQRIFAPSAPGSLLKRVGIVTPAPHKPDTEQDPAYLAMVRQCPCLSCGMEPSEADHLRMASAAYGKASGLGKKPADRWALPLCAQDHRIAQHAQHKRGEQDFWHALGINPLLCCAELYAQRTDLVAMRAVIFVTIAERSK